LHKILSNGAQVYILADRAASMRMAMPGCSRALSLRQLPFKAKPLAASR
jgi:hypothetical protein